MHVRATSRGGWLKPQRCADDDGWHLRAGVASCQPSPGPAAARSATWSPSTATILGLHDLRVLEGPP